MAKNISIKDRKVRIQMWDTAGQEAYRSITRSYYKSAACVFIVYDISDKKSFFDVDLWLKDCREICFKSVVGSFGWLSTSGFKPRWPKNSGVATPENPTFCGFFNFYLFFVFG